MCGHTELEAAHINHLHVPVTTFMFGSSGIQITQLLGYQTVESIPDPEDPEVSSRDPGVGTRELHRDEKSSPFLPRTQCLLPLSR